MKKLLVLGFLAVACSQQSNPADVKSQPKNPASIIIPVLLDNGMSVADYNKLAESEGVSLRLPETLEMKNNTKEDPFTELSVALEKVENEKLTQYLSLIDINDIKCYNGDAHATIDLITSLRDNVFSDQLIVGSYMLNGKVFDVDGKPIAVEDSGLDETNEIKVSSLQSPTTLFIDYSTDDDGTPTLGKIKICE